MRTLQVSKSVLDSFDFSSVDSYIPKHDNAKYFKLPSGVEHYRLFAYVSSLFQHQTIVDVGTFLGMSALALSTNETCNVVSFDIRKFANEPTTRKSNIIFHIDNVLDTLETYLDSPFMILDTNHDGQFEKEFIQRLSDLGYRGIVFCDDIHLNDDMKLLWKSVTQHTVDLTSVGHWSGTGAIIFDPTYLTIEIL